MLTEVKIFFQNLRNLRHLLTEAAGDSRIIDAIQNHEYLYIDYQGDGANKAGHRTIRPYVIGTTKAGNQVLRAWQDNYKSISFRSPGRRPDHEYWRDELDGKEKPGWRLFRVDRISNIYPMGKKFVDKEGNVIIPPKYREGGDQQMGGGIIAYVSSKTPAVRTNDMGGADKPDVVGQKVSAFDAQTNKWQRFYNANKANRRETAADIQKLYDIVKRVWKRSPNEFIVAINDKNEFEAIPIRNRDKVKPEAIVGSLMNLHDKFQPPKSTKPEQDAFVKQSLSKYEKEKQNKNATVNQNNLPERKTFFKQ